MINKTVPVLLSLMAAVFVNTGMAASDPGSDIKAWPLFYHASDPVTSETRTELFWPLYVRQRTPEYTVNQFLSFPQRYPSQYPNQFYLGWPLGGLRTGNGHDAWLFPFLWSSSDHFTLFPFVWYGDDYCSLFPAFYYGTGPGHSLNIAILQHNYWDEKERLHTLWPLLWYHNREDENSHSLKLGILPLYWQSEYAYTNKDNRSLSSSGGGLLLSWWHRSYHENTGGNDYSSTNSSGGLFPLYYRSNHSSTSSSDSHLSTNHHDALRIVLYRQSHDTNTVIRKNGAKPEITSETRRTFFPIWWDWTEQKYDENDSGRVILPLWWHSAKARANEITESATFLVPVGAHLYKKNEYETQNLFGPIFNRTENELKHYVRYDAFFPIFSATIGEDRSGGRLFPLTGWESERGKYSNLWYLFPFGWDCESQDDVEYRAESPQFFAFHDMEGRPFVNNEHWNDSGARSTAAFYPFYWSKRQADIQKSGSFPLWWKSTRRSGPDIYTDVTLPLFLGNYATSERNGREIYTRQDYLLSILAWGGGEDYKLRRIFPLFSYQNSYGHRDLSMLVPPFSYGTWKDKQKPDEHYSSKLSVPFSFLPLYRSEASQNGTNSESRTSWLFPFYKRSAERSEARDVKKMSILWPVWNGEWENDETRIRGLGGMCNFYERDANDFVEQRILYRLFSRRTRSWFSEHELMPFYSKQKREDGDSYWKILGGLIGSETRGDRSYFRLLFYPIPTGKAKKPDSGSIEEQKRIHSELALNYIKHDRYDRAAIEFTLAGDVSAGDVEYQLAAARAYLTADPDAIGKELRSTIPSSLESIGGKGGYCDSKAVLKNLRTLSISYFEKAITLGADKPDTLRAIAAAYRDMGQNETALEKLTESDQLCPRFAVGMERLKLLETLGWVGWFSGANIKSDTGNKRDKQKIIEYRRQWKALLSELITRYPSSPSLTHILAEEPEYSDSVVGLSRFDHFTLLRGYGNVDTNKLFSADTLRRLALYEQGAGMKAGSEETEWLSDRKTLGQRYRSSWQFKLYYQYPDGSAVPDRECAVGAIGILNAQVSSLVHHKKYDEITPLLVRIRDLLPKACKACDGGESEVDRYYGYNDPVETAMRNLYNVYIDQKKDPPAYIAAAEDWATTLCQHQKKAIERSLESVRFEQQYLKKWLITDSAGKFSPKTYSGKFFERYVNLDKILGQPDDCAVTAECVIESPDEREVVFRLGFDHALKAELNGQTIFKEKSRRIAVRDEFTVTARLKKGANTLSLKVADDTLAYGFFMRLSDKDGRYMKDLTIR